MNIIAHRGYSDLAPENTVASFDLALKKGFNIFELDVQLTNDKVPVIFHDYDFKRICGINSKVNELDFNYISELDVGSWFSKKFSSEKIPTFEKILQRYEKKVHLQIELKSHEKELAMIVIDLITKNNWLNLSQQSYKVPGYSITSFDFNNLIEVREITNDIRTGWLLNFEEHNNDDIFNSLERYNINMLIPNVKDKIWNNTTFINNLKEKGYILCAWGAKSVKDVERMKKIKISGMTVNWPTKASKVT